MSTISRIRQAPAALRARGAERASSLAFDWLIAVLGLWLAGGAHLDAWAHEHGLAESFFTPWHAVLYSGYLAMAAALAVTFLRNVRAHGWQQALPAGYGLSLVGAGVFFIGGVGDMLWHIAFGIEVSIEALLSPTHLILAIGAGLMVSGPLRAAWLRHSSSAIRRNNGAPGRDERPGLGSMLPGAISAALVVALMSFFTLYASPLGRITAGVETSGGVLSEALGVAGMLLYTTFITGMALFLVRRWRLPFGVLAVVLGVSTLLTAAVHERWWLAGAAVLAGLIADALIAWLRPGADRPGALHLFGAALPLVLWAAYYAGVALTTGISWSLELWAGSAVLAMIAGWVLSYLALPPRAPEA